MTPSFGTAFQDTFLEMHYAGCPLQFTIGGVISPISIRDQMIRAQMFVKRAVAEGLIGSKRPLLVVGGGAGGVAAALHAAEAGVLVTLMEKEAIPFRMQQLCFSRWIDPVQYDWPAGHWNQKTYPWKSLLELPSAVLPWAAGSASEIAAYWRLSLDAAREEFSDRFDYQPSTEFLDGSYDKAKKQVRVLFRDALPKDATDEMRKDMSGAKKKHFGAVLLALGFGAENVRCGSYSSLRFWQTDDFEKPRLGLKQPERDLKVLICGDGDGALQDFLRIATGLSSAEAILGKLLSDEDGLPSCVETQIEKRIYEAEDQAHRARLWSGQAADHATLTRLDAEHRACALEVLRDEKTGRKARVILGKLLGHSAGLDLKLIHRCEHFTALYPLNRFLVHLIVEYVRRGGITPAGKVKIEVLTGQRVLDVRCGWHDPNDKGQMEEDAHYCYGKPHWVQFARDLDCREKWEERAALSPGDRYELYDVVVLRLGLSRAEMPKALDKLPSLQIRRHSLPYHPPV